ncbi:cell division protein FtsW [candidate division WOR-3 bacterium]|nr:cell division protein FtsW [candidate division WOR-3 bacterium]
MQHAKPDKVLAFCVLCLVVLGTLFVYSSSFYRAMRKGEDSTFYLLGHLKRLGIALVFFFLGLFVPYTWIRKIVFPFFIVIVVMLITTLIAGRTQFGARRSLAIASFGLQISEFVRLWLVFFLANFFDAHPQMANTNHGMLMTIILSLIVIVLVAIQPSLSMALICFVVLIFMLMYGSARIRLVFPTVLASISLLVIFILVFPHAQYRITSFITNPTYQVQQSLIAVGSGGLLGKGIGAGLQKFMFLPRIHNDFIFAHIAEECGFIGCLIIFLLYWQIFLRGIRIAGSIEDDFARLLATGLNTTIFMMFLIHVGVSIGLLPPTGVPLPFISFGGWSLVANLYAIGILLQISKERTA